MLASLIYNGKKLYEDDKLEKEEILNSSEKKFRNILKLAYEKSEFYKNYYKSFGIEYGDLDKISINKVPTIDKKIVKENANDIFTIDIDKNNFYKKFKEEGMLKRYKDIYSVHTSGSTGLPCEFFYSKKALTILESNFARLSLYGDNSIGIKDFPITSLYIAPVGTGYACTTLAIFGMNLYKARNVIIDAKSELSTWKIQIGKFKPIYLSGYPSCINLIADLQERGEINIHPKKIIIGGEPSTEQIREYYKKVFGADVIDYYGCTESIFIGASSTMWEGIYFPDDLNYSEVDNRNRIIITPLYNEVYPLIRYKLNDVIEGFDKKHKGFFNYTYGKKILGRYEELMWFKNESGEIDFLHPLFLDDLQVKGVIKYQFHQKSREEFTIKCVSLQKNKKEQIKLIRKQIDKFLNYKKMRNVNYNLEFVNKLEVDILTGKVKMVVKNKNL